MAWLCSGSSNSELIANMQQAGLIASQRVADAMKETDRKCYVPVKSVAYRDEPQPIGFNATISAPHMHAHALESLLPFLSPGSRALDVGCGSGYLTAVMHRLVGNEGLVVGIDHLPGLVDMSGSNMAEDGVELVPPDQPKGVVLIEGDGRKGFPSLAPYSAIHVGACAPTLPLPLVEQLASPGRMFIPIEGPGGQDVWQIDKDKEGRVGERKLFGVRYVPLTDREKQWSKG